MAFRKDIWLPLSGMVLWLAASIAALKYGDASQFQRAGTLGIAAAIALFGFLRKRLAEASTSIALAHEAMGLDELKLAIQETKLDLLRVISSVSARAVTDPEFDKNMKDHFLPIESKQAYLSEKLGQRAKHIEVTKRNHSKLEHHVVATEFSVLVLATLQTGYGDVIVRTLSGGN